MAPILLDAHPGSTFALPWLRISYVIATQTEVLVVHVAFWSRNSQRLRTMARIKDNNHDIARTSR
jgi:hypothetical protein